MARPEPKRRAGLGRPDAALWQDETMRGVAALLLLSGLLAAPPGCRDAARALGSGPAGPIAADELVVALATRFGPIEREPAFDVLRPKLARAALVPSRVFDAADVWTASEGELRQLEFFGRRDGTRYRIGVRPSAPRPRAAGEHRGRLRLRRIEDGRFEWAFAEELAVGPIAPEVLSRALTALFRSAEGVSGEEARARAREAFPRAARSFSRLFRLETLELTPAGEGSTAVHLGLRLAPAGLRETAPRYAAFLEEHARPMRARVTVTDASGTPWWTFEAEDLLWTLRLRVRHGSLVPLEGPADRPMPGVLSVHVDYSARVGIFTVGVRDLVAEVTLTRTPTDKGFVARFREEPDWRLPFLVEPLLRASLRYPFADEGSELTYALRSSPGGETCLLREFRLRVRESWITRWLGGASDLMIRDFRRGAESESDRYSRECLYALRDDIVTLLNEPE
jgi:hypothetical protein